MRPLGINTKITLVFASFALCMGLMSHFSGGSTAVTTESIYDEYSSELNVSESAPATDRQAIGKQRAQAHRTQQNRQRPTRTYRKNHGNHPTLPSRIAVNKTKTNPNKKKKTQKKKKKRKKTKIVKKKKRRNQNNKDQQTADTSGELDSNAPFIGTNLLAAQNNASTNTGSVNGQNSGETQTDEDEEKNSLDNFEAWQEPIFVNESFEAVTELLSSFDSRNVSKGVFYDVVTEMSIDQRINIREFGVIAMAATPSTDSFALLSFVKNNDSDQSLRSNANLHLQDYAGSSKLTHAVSALRPSNFASEDQVHLDALVTIEKGATLLGSGQTSADDNSTGRAIQDIARAADLIDAHHASSPDAAIRTQARKTMTEIRRQLRVVAGNSTASL